MQYSGESKLILGYELKSKEEVEELQKSIEDEEIVILSSFRHAEFQTAVYGVVIKDAVEYMPPPIIELPDLETKINAKIDLVMQSINKNSEKDYGVPKLYLWSTSGD